ncbi:Xaa-Pro aminopeptidase [Vreelandella utahensis]|uniref:Xaa-Pro aminopeptidase n=1 Tax=Vreelandella halophila TaxID=86177 RepID=UPI0009876BB9|nr:Xaa-Pro aminopeptidase [Halomonas utahensis]
MTVASKQTQTAIDRDEHASRRRRLMEQMAPESIAIVSAAPERIRSRDTEYPYRQDSDFLYLTGFEEPHAVLVLVPGREHGETVLFCRERDPDRELWDGFMVGPDSAVANYGVDDAFPITDIDDILPGLIEGRSRVYYSIGRDSAFDSQVMEWVNSIRARVRSGAKPPGEFVALEHTLHDMRLYKSAAELRVMEQAGRISANAHRQAMRRARPGLREYQLEAELLYRFLDEGASAPAYPTIVASGSHGCVLHYTENQGMLADGDLVLIDAGCEYNGYAADITRTFPVNGRFTGEQKAVYEIVLAAQKAAIEKVRPENHWNQPHEAAVEVLSQGLLDLGILTGSLEEVVEQAHYRDFFMHRTGHWLGMDVHDVGDYRIGGAWRVLEPGMVMTIEPGLYIAPGKVGVDERWQGIAVRIEDDVAVTRSGYRNLTPDVPKEIADIEALMADE